MPKLGRTESGRMYSWWWDSHISPKNSKWLQENLADIDAKVKVMIKLIEEDADSFARRAEMYYKKRPELMRMVEEFYRAYRALAERYDHATGVIQHAHRTMAEAFPNQIPSLFDDSPVVSGTDPRTPEDRVFKHNGEFTSDSDTAARRKALKQQLNYPSGSIERVRKGLSFDETEEKESCRFEKLLKPDEEHEPEEILKLKESIAKLESEKEAGLVQYQESLDKLSQLESEISQAREDLRVFSDRATKAENEVVVLKESLSKLESEKELKLQEYERSLDKLSDLEAIISNAQEDAEKSNQRACIAETEAQSLRVERDKLATEKDAALDQYLQSLDAISNLEKKLRVTEEDATGLKERAEKAEGEIEILKLTISKLTDEKEAAALQYQQCLERISDLEDKLERAQDEAKQLNIEIDSGVSKLKGAEEKCLLLERSNQSLHSELDALMMKMGTQAQDLTEKQKEVGQLWGCVQEERLRFVEAETAFQTLQHLHAQTQEELRSRASELQKRAQHLKVSQDHNQSLQDEVLRVNEENKRLDELNESSSLSIKDMQNEISRLKDSTGKLEEEVELRLDERNALQQEIYCLKEELNDLQKKHHSVVDQVYMVGLNPESFGSSVRGLQDENSNLKENWDRERRDKTALLAKLEAMEQLLEKNAVLETSISDLNAELDTVRGKIVMLEQSVESLSKEKSALFDERATLVTQLQETKKNLQSLAENNTVMVNSLNDAYNQLEALKFKSKMLEDSCQLLKTEKADITRENDDLTFQLENTQKRLEEVGEYHGELKGRYIALEKERDSNLREVQELQLALEVARQEHGNYIQISESRLMGVEAEICDLHKECLSRKKELDEVIDNALNFEIEMSVLQRTVQELKQENFSLALKNQELLEKFTLSEKIVSQLEKNNDEQQFEIKSLSDQASSLRTGTYQLLKVLDIVQDPALKDKAELFHINFDQLFSNVQDLKTSLCKAEEESHIWAVELSILIEWIKLLKLEVRNLEVERSNIEHEFKERTEQLLTVQNEVHKHLETNENLRKKLKEGDCVKELLMSQIEDLRRNLMEMKGACKVLRRENSEVYAGKKSLMEKFCHLEEKNNVLEEENYVLCENMLVLDHLSLIFRSYAEEKLMAVNKLNADRNKLHDMNGVLVEKLNLAEESAEESNIEILHLKQQLQRSADELKVVAAVKDQLYGDIENGKNVQNQMKLELQEAEQKINIVEKNHLVQLSAVQDEVSKHLETNENLRQKLKEGECAKEKLMSQIEDLRRNLMDMQGACEVLRREKSEVYEEKESLAEKFLHLEEKNNILEEENCVLCENMLSFDNLSLIFRSFSEEKLMAVNKLNEDRNKLHDMNGVLAGKLRLAEGSAEESNIEILHLKQQLQRSEDELKVVAAVKDQLCGDIENGKNVLNQMKLELQEAEQKMNIVEKNHLVQLSAVQDEVSKHLETNENLRQKLKEGDCVKVELMTQIEDLRRNLVDLQGACEVLRREKSKVYEEKKSLREKFLHLDEKNNVLEAEYCVLCDNMLALDNLSLIFRSFSQEILIAVNELNEDRNKLHDMNGVLVGKLRLAEGRAEESNIEILHLKQQLQRSEDELKVVAAVKDQLCSDIENGKNVLNQMELELQEAEQKISIVEKKKFELHKIVEDLKIESDEIKIIRDDQENQILQLSAKNDCLNVENNCLHEARQILEVKIQDLHEELNKSKSQGENLESELKMKVEEIEDLEIQATSVFGQLECSRVSQLLFEQKFHELQQVCLDYIDQNESLKNQVAAFRPEIASLKECVASLEKDTDPLIRPQSSKDAELQGAEVITDLQGNKLNKDDKAPVQDIFSDLRDLHARLQAYEKASAAIKEVMVQESIELHSKLDTSLKQIEFLKSESWRYRRSLKQSSEISEAENALLMKDIMLDQMSNGSPYGVSRRETTDAADQIVELWEDIDPKKNQKDTLLASDESIGIEPSVDKLELSKRYSGHVQEENKRKVLDRLDSDVQKLANLQIAVQDMKRKLQVTEKGKRGKSVIQCEVLKGQLEEADTAIMKLFDFNGKLIKTVESSTFADVKSSFDLEGDGKAKRRVSEQARRISEKIGRLQLEVQKLQFILLKLDDEKEGKSNLSDIRRRILLRDYLYGGRRPTGQGRKNAPFCGCFDTSTFDH